MGSPPALKTLMRLKRYKDHAAARWVMSVTISIVTSMLHNWLTLHHHKIEIFYTVIHKMTALRVQIILFNSPNLHGTIRFTIYTIAITDYFVQLCDPYKFSFFPSTIRRAWNNLPIEADTLLLYDVYLHSGGPLDKLLI